MDPHGGPDSPQSPNAEPGLIDLVGRVASDALDLLKQEGRLATLQARDVFVAALWGSLRVGVPIALAAIAGVLLVIGGVAWLTESLGSLWAGTLVAGGSLLLVALVLLALAALSLKPAPRVQPSVPAPPDGDDGRPKLVTGGE
ncbi:MAG: phage holin family protein [Gemmatimonadota bacterium]